MTERQIAVAINYGKIYLLNLENTNYIMLKDKLE